MIVVAQFGQMAGKTCQGHFKDNIHVLSHFSMLRKCMLMLALALIQYWALSLEGHTQQVGTCLLRLEMNLHSHNTRTLCKSCREKRGNQGPKSLLQAHHNFQHVQGMMTKYFADIIRLRCC